jgi:hypothetical protein
VAAVALRPSVQVRKFTAPSFRLQQSQKPPSGSAEADAERYAEEEEEGVEYAEEDYDDVPYEFNPTPFVPPANSPAGFLAELRSFAAKFPTHEAEDLVQELPLRFSGDPEAVLTGQRRVVSASSAFSFACTGCGACCRTFPNDVMLDTHDVWLLSRAAGAAGGLKSTTDLHAQFPKAFNQQLGLFESGDHPSEDTVRKMAPVMFLRSKRVKQVASRTKAERIEERCWFAVQGDKTEVELADEAPHADDDGNTTRPPVVKPPSRKATWSNTPEPGLRCSLGKDNMPTACALYPLGELYNGPAATAATETGTATGGEGKENTNTNNTQYYTLDVTNCEGTRALPTEGLPFNPHTTVAAYAERNGLPQRRIEWEWFERTLVQPIATKGWMSYDPYPEQRAALTINFRHRLTTAITELWYDFDSLDLTPTLSEVVAPSAAAAAVGVQPKVITTRAFPDWPAARDAILNGTQLIMEATETYMRECGPEPEVAVQLAAESKWLDTLQSAGIFKRAALQPKEEPEPNEDQQHERSVRARDLKAQRFGPH